MSERCTGHCCRVFHLPYSMEEMKAKQGTLQDGEFIADMLVPLGSGTSWPGDCPPEPGDENAMRHYYTCRHFDAEKGQCTAYEQRPRMCRDYPYERECTYEGCTYKPDVKVESLIKKMKDKLPGVPTGMLDALLTPEVIEALANEKPAGLKTKKHPLTVEQRLERIERRLGILTDETE